MRYLNPSAWKTHGLKWRIFLLMLGAGVVFSSRALGFEGKVDYDVMSNDHQLSTMTYFLKGNQLRIDTKTKDKVSTVIFDLKARKMFVLMPGLKKYIEASTGGLPKDKKGINSSRSGKTDVILGRKCEERVYKDKNLQISFWGIPELQNPADINKNITQANGGLPEGVMNGFVSLKMVYKDGKGKVLKSIVATKMEEGPLDAGLFMVPAGYQKMNASPTMERTPVKPHHHKKKSEI